MRMEKTSCSPMESYGFRSKLGVRAPIGDSSSQSSSAPIGQLGVRSEVLVDVFGLNLQTQIKRYLELAVAGHLRGIV